MYEPFRVLNKKVTGSAVNIRTAESIARRYGQAKKERKTEKGLTGNLRLHDLAHVDPVSARVR